MLGANARNDAESPDIRPIASQTTATFDSLLRSGAAEVMVPYALGVTAIDPTVWDDGSGTPATVANNNWTVQTFYIAATGAIIHTLGQEQFNTQTLAEQAVLDGIALEEYPSIASTVRRCFLVVSEGATDLSLSTQATFFTDGPFRAQGVSTTGAVTGVSSPGGSDTNIQFNAAGTFGGSNNLTWDGSNVGLTGTLNSATINQDVSNNLYIGSSIPTTINNKNTAFGVDALSGLNNVASQENTAVGHGAGSSMTEGTDCVFVGHNAGAQATDIDNSIYIGSQIGGTSSSGASDNILIGHLMGQNMSGFQGGMIMVGSSSGAGSVNNTNTVIIGNSAGDTYNGSKGVLIGWDVDGPASGDEYINIGNVFFGNGTAQKARIGGTSTKPNGNETLNVQGDFLATGKVNGLTIDADEVNSNVFIGRDLPVNMLSGNLSIGVGAGASINNLLNANMTLLGTDTASSATVILDSTCLGHDTAGTAATIEYSTLLGSEAGTNSTGIINNSIIVGHQANVYSAANTVDFLNIGDLVFGDLSGGFVSIGGSVAKPSGPEVLLVNGDVSAGDYNSVTIEQDSNDLFVGTSIPATTGGLNTVFGINALDSINDAGVTNNVAIGFGAGTALTGEGSSSRSNVFIGRNAASEIINGLQVIAIGQNTFGALDGGGSSIGIGNSAFNVLAGTATRNIGIGTNVADLMVSGSDNTFISNNGAATLTGGSRNLLIGYSADVPAASTDDFMNIGDLLFADLSNGYMAIGGSLAKPAGPETLLVNGDVSAGSYNGADIEKDTDNNIYIGGAIPATIGSDNIAIGDNALDSISDALSTGNVVIGDGAATSITSTNSPSVIIGRSAYQNATGGGQQVIIGTGAANNGITAGFQSVVVGNGAGNNVTGNLTRDTIIGGNTGNTFVTGTDVTLIGWGADVPAATTSDFLNITDVIFADTDNGYVQIGGSVAKPAGPETLLVSGDVVGGSYNGLSI